MKVNGPVAPRARMERLLIQELADETLVYDLDRNEAHCLNQTAALVWRHCDGRRTVTQIARALENETKLRVNDEVVLMACHQLAKRHLMQDEISIMSIAAGITRRDVVQRIGWTVAVSLPVVSSIVAPDAVQAATCRPPGQACTTGAQCCNGVCNAGTCA